MGLLITILAGFTNQNSTERQLFSVLHLIIFTFKTYASDNTRIREYIACKADDPRLAVLTEFNYPIHSWMDVIER